MKAASKVQKGLIGRFARNRREARVFMRIALDHNRARDAGEACPFSTTRSPREAFVGLLLRYAYDTPGLFIMAPLVAAVLYGLMLASLLRHVF